MFTFFVYFFWKCRLLTETNLNGFEFHFFFLRYGTLNSGQCQLHRNTEKSGQYCLLIWLLHLTPTGFNWIKMYFAHVDFDLKCCSCNNNVGKWLILYEDVSEPCGACVCSVYVTPYSYLQTPTFGTVHFFWLIFILLDIQNSLRDSTIAASISHQKTSNKHHTLFWPSNYFYEN